MSRYIDKDSLIKRLKNRNYVGNCIFCDYYETCVNRKGSHKNCWKDITVNEINGYEIFPNNMNMDYDEWEYADSISELPIEESDYKERLYGKAKLSWNGKSVERECEFWLSAFSKEQTPENILEREIVNWWLWKYNGTRIPDEECESAMTEVEYYKEKCYWQQRYIDGKIKQSELEGQLELLRQKYTKYLVKENIKLLTQKEQNEQNETNKVLLDNLEKLKESVVRRPISVVDSYTMLMEE